MADYFTSLVLADRPTRSGRPARRSTRRKLGRAILVGLVATMSMGRATVAAGQGPSGPCNLYFDDTDTTRTTSLKLPSGKYNSFIGGGVLAHCTNQRGVRLKSDSAEFYGEQGLLYLIGRVHYTDPRAVVDAHHMTYYVSDGRLVADTNVVAVLPSGTTMHGPHADYLRVLAGVRDRASLTAPGRPHIHLVQRDSTTSTPDTAGIDADLVYMVGDSLVYASHKVIIQRTDLTATGDSAFVDQGQGFIRLMRTPVITGKEQQHPFTLRGDVIDVFTENHQLKRVLSKLHADAVSKDMHLTSDTIDLRFHEKVLSRAYAWGPSRARAVTPDRDILADSIDVIMPGQEVHQVRSVRKAFAQAVPDTTQFKSKERDWMKGDTIIAYFDTLGGRSKAAHSSKTSSPDTASTPGGGKPPSSGSIDRPVATDSTVHVKNTKPAADTQPQVIAIESSGHARAYYQLPPRDHSLKVPAIDYMEGRVITIYFENRLVKTVTVIDSARGVYLEPQSDTAARDSARRARLAADTLPKAKKKPGTPPAKTPGSVCEASAHNRLGCARAKYAYVDNAQLDRLSAWWRAGVDAAGVVVAHCDLATIDVSPDRAASRCAATHCAARRCGDLA